ncbi:4-azaleucine resistance transporter AzlC [Stackebrandtia albiflava]|uniref:4-azaleucine resistance transporter AzlC n=2 Tax=Stackebrandtia albiflava TaxID=406432 RepID=A0A562VBV8_9ACTN|nr:4-azaleucine resistance transporter AzlC [Stackebrandtia albiflava]
MRDVAPLATGAAFIGASFGAIAVSTGMAWWVPCLMSVLVFAGASQFLAVGVIAAGGGPVAAVVGGLILNARHLPFGLAIGDVLGTGPWRRIVGSHLLIDESAAFALGRAHDPRSARAAYWACGIGMFVTWNLGTVAGAFAGRIVSDTDALGLDAAFPAALLALLLPALREHATLRAALVGAVIAVVTTPFVPGGVNVLLALLGLAAGWPRRDHATGPDRATPADTGGRA